MSTRPGCNQYKHAPGCGHTSAGSRAEADLDLGIALDEMGRGLDVAEAAYRQHAAAHPPRNWDVPPAPAREVPEDAEPLSYKTGVTHIRPGDFVQPMLLVDPPHWLGEYPYHAVGERAVEVVSVEVDYHEDEPEMTPSAEVTLADGTALSFPRYQDLQDAYVDVFRPTLDDLDRGGSTWR